jgi:putative sterol carrier protein
MTSSTEEFFDELVRRGHEPRLEKVSGTVRFDLENGNGVERWLVTVDKGDISVSRKNGKADAVMRTDKALFDRILTGEVNAMAATLRGLLTIEGDRELLVLIQRLFAGTPTTRQPRSTVDAGRRQS